MANKISKNMTFSLDNAAGSLTAISGQVNSASLNGIQAVLEDTGLGVGNSTRINGLAGATIALSGFVNSTTDGIFGPLIGNYTSVSKTFSYYNGLRYYTGEAFVENPTQSGNVGELQTWSCTLQITGAVSRTSVAPT